MIRMSDPARALLAAASIFLTGAVAGVGLDRLILIPAHAHASDATARRALLRDHDEVLAELAEELGFTSEQSASVRAIFARHQAEIDRAWTEVHANLRSAIGVATTEVEGVLDDDQVRRLHAWIAEHHGPIPGHPTGRAH